MANLEIATLEAVQARHVMARVELSLVVVAPEPVDDEDSSIRAEQLTTVLNARIDELCSLVDGLTFQLSESEEVKI